ncbi:hypothetical protein [Paenibacillus sp. RC67]|uniref:hypothetical protein n=1 Tax=Paenibacillus sp. RC67 TaxID=3039392 RepID=UPI0024AD986E|nr:hypothetical protein [Paenibacillus sp. RC67]
MYAVEMFFDTNLEDFVKDVWKELHHQSISSYMYDIEELRPHLTLAVYNEVQESAIADLVKDFRGFFFISKNR